MSGRPLRRLLIICSVALMVGVAACRPSTVPDSVAGGGAAPAAGATGGSTTASSPPGGATGGGYACHLVTATEAGAALGTSVSPTEQDQGVVKTCRFRPAEATGGSVYLSVLDASAADFLTATENLPVAHVAIAGVGDRAVFAAGAGELVALSGTHMISVIIVHKGVIFGTESEARGLATAAIGRL